MSYYPTLTYKQNRKCLHCGKPIADQEHAARKFCPRVALAGANVLSCKDDYHSKKNRPLLAPFRRIAQWHRVYHSRIRLLLEREGDRVNLEIINRYGINLNRPFEFKIKQNGKFIFYFYEFAIEQISENQFYIFRHGLPQ